ncbi:MAG TPA: hypothetical protein DDX19_14225 [Rhodopirellula baltica]|uniref:Uncharacterized protein n=1 Tax=Rhodopirellula baltica (strain DSM 10527 / NCIMB 13988 / SH1) TaxID=243090 RepID=Q7ULP4_RHOBA|nr:hypothetical protein [Rhodopirellula baltica]CAD76225.1 hypothetical protein RB9369 [Rhodopirellula baltica SH 1]HBE63864.1 hypothetical protein [Rhodopirellula baltica]
MSSSISTPPAHQLQTENGSLQIRFEWQQDRYAHIVRWQSETGEVAEARSVEGSSDQDWPASPALQQLSTETIEGVPTILGVGCAGSSHFSVSVQVLEKADAEESDSESPRVRFDWAVRMSASDAKEHPVANLGTQYAAENMLATSLLGQTQSVRDSDSDGGIRFVPDQSAGGPTRQWSYDLLGAT